MFGVGLELVLDGALGGSASIARFGALLLVASAVGAAGAAVGTLRRALPALTGARSLRVS